MGRGVFSAAMFALTATIGICLFATNASAETYPHQIFCTAIVGLGPDSNRNEYTEIVSVRSAVEEKAFKDAFAILAERDSALSQHCLSDSELDWSNYLNYRTARRSGSNVDSRLVSVVIPQKSLRSVEAGAGAGAVISSNRTAAGQPGSVKGSRLKHHPELVANMCVTTDHRGDGYRFTNNCRFPVGFSWCSKGTDCPRDQTGRSALSIELKPGEGYTSYGNVGQFLRQAACRRSAGYVEVKLLPTGRAQCLAR